MERKLKLIPIWLWVSVIIIIVLLCGCRGGRSLGKGSAGTVIVPQTPQEINEKNAAPILEPLPPTPISIAPAPPKNPTVITPPVVKLPPAPPVKLTPAKTRPTPTPNSSANANPVIINPKSAGEQKPFAPTHSNRNAPPAKLVNVIKLPDDNGKGTQIAGPCEAAPEERPFIKWGELISYWLFVILMVIFGWVVYDTVMGFIKEKKLGNKENSRAKKAQEKLIKKPAKGTKASRKKALSKKNENPKR